MIRNLTKQRILSKEEKICKTCFSKLKGLMFTHRIEKSLIFVNKRPFKTRVHMLFVFYPIEVAWLDENKKIIYKEILKPFSISKPVKAKYIIEMPLGQLKSRINDKLEFET